MLIDERNIDVKTIKTLRNIRDTYRYKIRGVDKVIIQIEEPQHRNTVNELILRCFKSSVIYKQKTTI